MNSTVFEMIIRVFGAFLSIYSFAVLLQVPRRFVLQAGIVGAIGGFVYLLAIHFGMPGFFRLFPETGCTRRFII